MYILFNESTSNKEKEIFDKRELYCLNVLCMCVLFNENACNEEKEILTEEIYSMYSFLQKIVTW